MNLIIEGTFLNFNKTTGIERHFFLQLEILERINLFEKIYIVTKQSLPDNISNLNLNIENIVIDQCDSDTWQNIYSNTKFEFLYSTFEPPAILPKNKPVFYVLHDPGRYLYPEMMQKGALDDHIKLFDIYANSNNFNVITVSHSSKNDILKIFPQLKNRIFVVYNFIPHIFDKLKKSNINEWHFPFSKGKYFLTVGKYIPTKNTLSVTKAFIKRSNDLRDYSLIILGRKGWYEEFEKFIDKNPENIFSYDYIEDKELYSLYSNSYAFISASLYEGFGLPLIEAKYCGCPKIFHSSISAYQELKIEGSIEFDPFNENDIIKKVFSKCYSQTKLKTDDLSNFKIESVANSLKYAFKKYL